MSGAAFYFNFVDNIGTGLKVQQNGIAMPVNNVDPGNSIKGKSSSTILFDAGKPTGKLSATFSAATPAGPKPRTMTIEYKPKPNDANEMDCTLTMENDPWAGCEIKVQLVNPRIGLYTITSGAAAAINRSWSFPKGRDLRIEVVKG